MILIQFRGTVACLGGESTRRKVQFTIGPFHFGAILFVRFTAASPFFFMKSTIHGSVAVLLHVQCTFCSKPGTGCIVCITRGKACMGVAMKVGHNRSA